MAAAGKLETEVTEKELKKHSGEFDLECIDFLDLSDRGLTSLGAVPLCSSLRVLHLSCNSLTSATALGQLTQLEELDLSANHITGVDGFEKLGALRRLDLPGNKIAQLEALLPLAGLLHLKHLTLQLPGTSLTNPVCSVPTYQAFTRETFPTLVWLDGEKMSGPGSEFYTQCRGIDEQLERAADRHKNGLGDGNGDSEKQSVESLEDPLARMTLSDELAAEAVSKLLAECGETSHRLQEHIAALRKELAVDILTPAQS